MHRTAFQEPPKPTSSPLFPQEVSLPPPPLSPLPPIPPFSTPKNQNPLPKKPHKTPLNYNQAIETITHLSEHATVAAEVKTYLQNIVVFLRMHRAVDSGISPRATKHFDQLVTYLLPPTQLHPPTGSKKNPGSLPPCTIYPTPHPLLSRSPRARSIRTVSASRPRRTNAACSTEAISRL